MSTSVVSLLAGLVSAPILAHLLPKQEYGALSYVGSLQGFVVALSAPGLASAISYSVARGNEVHFREGTLRRVRLYLRNGLFMLAVSAWYLWKERQPALAFLIALGAVLLPWSHAFDTGEQFLVGRSDFNSIFWRRILCIILIALSSIAAAWFCPTAVSVHFSRGLISAIMYISIFLILLRTVRNDNRDPEFEKKSKDFSIVSIAGVMAGLTDRLVLGTIGDLGILAGYSLSRTVTVPMETVTKSLNKIAFGRMAINRPTSQRHFWVCLSVLIATVGSGSILIVWRIALPVVNALFPKYPELSQMVPILLVGCVLNSGSSLGLVYTQFHAFDAWKRYELITGVSKIIVMAVAVVIAGVWGALWTHLINAAVSFVFFNTLLWRGTPMAGAVGIENEV
jgi:O-antigen/teichoic acid export membrane protein